MTPRVLIWDARMESFEVWLFLFVAIGPMVDNNWQLRQCRCVLLKVILEPLHPKPQTDELRTFVCPCPKLLLKTRVLFSHYWGLVFRALRPFPNQLGSGALNYRVLPIHWRSNSQHFGGVAGWWLLIIGSSVFRKISVEIFICRFSGSHGFCCFLFSSMEQSVVFLVFCRERCS